MDLKVRHIDKRFKNQTVLENISFDVGSRELVSIVGPSGVGKTTLLKIIARLDTPDAGEVLFSVPPTQKHPVIIVFQDYVLFPSMTVRDNIGFGLRMQKLDKDVIDKRVKSSAELLHIENLLERHPAHGARVAVDVVADTGLRAAEVERIVEGRAADALDAGQCVVPGTARVLCNRHRNIQNHGA